MEINFIESIDSISESEWDNLIETDYPFLKHSFFTALERSKCIGPNTGWMPFYLLLYENKELVGLMPLFLKTNSSGEFIFDWSWADAFYRNGMQYYPKLVSSIPFTPASGPRLCLKKNLNKSETIRLIMSEIKQISVQLEISSFHILYPDPKEKTAFKNSELSLRTNNSFHWFNKGYKKFENFLDDFTSRQRKNVKKERDKIKKQGLTMVRFLGPDITEEMWDIFYLFYKRTNGIRGSGGYLNLEFFKIIGELMPNSLLLVMCKNESNEYIAGALNFYDTKTLFGRYWGSIEDYDALHFETCYYQGIDFCIENNISKFDPGVQGEHKIKRGFCPIETYSFHWIKDERFKEPIDNFLLEEKQHITSYNQACIKQLPFKEDLIKDIYKDGFNIR